MTRESLITLMIISTEFETKVGVKDTVEIMLAHHWPKEQTEFNLYDARAMRQHLKYYYRG